MKSLSLLIKSSFLPDKDNLNCGNPSIFDTLKLSVDLFEYNAQGFMKEYLHYD